MITVRVSDGKATKFNSQVLVQSYDETSGAPKICGDSNIHDSIPVYLFLTVEHSTKELVLDVTNVNYNRLDRAYYGIREVTLLFSTNTISTSSHIGLSTPVNILQDTHYLCPLKQYRNLAGNCVNCHPGCGACSNGGDDNCHFCSFGYVYNGIRCVPCYGNCETCFGSLITQCITCPTGSFMYRNTTCLPHCPDPYIIRHANGMVYCDFPCNPDDYFYTINRTCLSTVSFPFNVRIEGDDKFADYPCNLNSVIYKDGSCKTYCDDPMTVIHEAQVKYCSGPCADSRLFFIENLYICNETCTLPYTPVVTQYYNMCNRPPGEPLTWSVDIIAPIVTIALIVMSILFLDYPWAIIVFIFARMMQYCRHFFISYANEETTMLASWNLRYINLDFSISIPIDIAKSLVLRKLNAVYSNYYVHSSFLFNFWPNLVVIAMAVAAFAGFGVFELISKYYSSNGKGSSFLQFFRVKAQTFLLIALYGSYGNVIFYTLIQLQGMDLESKTAVFSFILSVAFVITGVIVVIFHIRFLIKQVKHKQKNLFLEEKVDIKDFLKRYPGVQIFFKGFKLDSVFQQGFMIFLIFRDAFHSMAIVFSIKFPLIQAVFVSSLDLIGIIYYIIGKPFKDRFDGIQLVFYETLMIVTHVIGGGVSYLDNTPNEFMEIRALLGKAVLYLHAAFTWAVPVFLGIKILRVIKNFFMTSKESEKMTATASSSNVFQLSEITNPNAEDAHHLSLFHSYPDSIEEDIFSHSNGEHGENDSNIQNDESHYNDVSTIKDEPRIKDESLVQELISPTNKLKTKPKPKSLRKTKAERRLEESPERVLANQMIKMDQKRLNAKKKKEKDEKEEKQDKSAKQLNWRDMPLEMVGFTTAHSGHSSNHITQRTSSTMGNRSEVDLQCKERSQLIPNLSSSNIQIEFDSRSLLSSPSKLLPRGITKIPASQGGSLLRLERNLSKKSEDADRSNKSLGQGLENNPENQNNLG